MIKQFGSRMRAASVMLAIALAAACDTPSPVRRAEASSTAPSAQLERELHDRNRQDSITRSRPGYVIDSILPVEEEIRRFQATLGPAPDSLRNGASSRAALVDAFVRALERNDTTALTRLVVDREEFGFLIYPTSANARPPYRQSPELVWLQRSAATQKAASRLLGRFGGRPLGFAGYVCPRPADRQGANTLWTSCVVRRTPAVGNAQPEPLRMFGPIVERGGRYKLLSLANAL